MVGASIRAIGRATSVIAFGLALGFPVGDAFAKKTNESEKAKTERPTASDLQAISRGGAPRIADESDADEMARSIAAAAEGEAGETGVHKPVIEIKDIKFGQKKADDRASDEPNRRKPDSVAAKAEPKKAEPAAPAKDHGHAPAHAAPVQDDTTAHGAAHDHGARASASAPGTHAPSSGHGAFTPVPAETSLRWLKNGNTRYVKEWYRKDGRGIKDRSRLASGQQPHAIVLSCADSRVPPELVFDQGLGEIFTVRVAGEALDSSVIASIEYAVEHLGSQLIVVMGHTSCGAVNAAISTKEGDSAGSPELDKLVADIRPRLKTVMKDPRSPSLEVESTLNADGVARDLVKRSEVIRKRVEAGKLTIKSALYRMDSGKVNFY